ncbi:MAG TPA: DUF5908 family protein [Thermoanaerobaculia bacterium]|jgi:hypothetical protein
MAFEIRELVIRAVVDAAPAGGAPAAPGGGGSPPPSAAAIVGDCVEQVLEILRRREER